MRKTNILLILTMLIVVGCQTQTNTGNLDTNKQLVRDYSKEVLIQHNLEAMDKYVKENYIQHNPGTGQGREGIRTFFKSAFEGVPDWDYQIQQIAAEGDKVWVYATVTGTHKGTWLGMPATNKKINVNLVDVYRIEDGMLVEHWDVVDFYTLLKQLGAIA